MGSCCPPSRTTNLNVVTIAMWHKVVFIILAATANVVPVVVGNLFHADVSDKTALPILAMTSHYAALITGNLMFSFLISPVEPHDSEIIVT